MKKTLLITSIIGALCFTGCNKGIVEELTGPTDKWCKTEVQVNGKASETETAKDYTLDVYCYYGTSEKEVQIGSGTEKTKLVKGLNIIISTKDEDKNTIFSSVTGSNHPYIFKSFAEGNNVPVEDDTGKEKNVSLKKSMWTIIYNCNNWSKTYSNDTLPLIDSATDYSSAGELKTDFSISKILKKMAANKLMEILEE